MGFEDEVTSVFITKDNAPNNRIEEIMEDAKNPKWENMDIENFKIQCSESISTFKEKVFPMSHLDNGILIREGFAFCAMCDYFSVDLIIESGMARGMSTEMFAKYFDTEVISIDNALVYGTQIFNNTKNRLSKYHNVTCIMGNSLKKIPMILNSHKDAKVGIFLDGPKGKEAVKFAKKCFKYPSVKFVGIHDECFPKRYHEMDLWNKTFFYTDADWFMDKYYNLDLLGEEKDQLKVKSDILDFNPNGHGIGFAIN